MNLADLVRAYFSYPAIQVYLVLGVVTLLAAVDRMKGPETLVWAALLTPLLYSLAWYLIHRYLLHGSYLYKSPQTAALWKRIHYDHHRDPHDLAVLFGALPTTLPTIVLITVPVGLVLDGLTGAAAMFSMGLFITCFYEFCHCIQHLAYIPRNAFMRRVKRLHMAHHFHNETGNFGITNFWWDRMMGTFYAQPQDRPRSPTVFNLGYTGKAAQEFPWVAQLTGPESPSSSQKSA